jgi:putative membrane protein
MRQFTLAFTLALACALAGLFGASLAHAQIGNPAGMAPATPESEPGKPAPGYPNTTDRLFVHLMATGGMAEIESAKLAESKAGGPTQGFARRMLQDHGPAHEQLARLAQQNQIPLPTRTDPDHRAMQAQLQGLSGPAFDRAYLQGQIVDHQKTVQLLHWEIAAGQDANLQRYAAATLPTVLQHLQTLQHLQSSMTGAPPQGLAAAQWSGMPPTAAGRAPAADKSRRD